jgi:hypothetical protein
LHIIATQRHPKRSICVSANRQSSIADLQLVLKPNQPRCDLFLLGPWRRHLLDESRDRGSEPDAAFAGEYFPYGVPPPLHLVSGGQQRSLTLLNSRASRPPGVSNFF